MSKPFQHLQHAINKKLKIIKKNNPIKERVFKNDPYLFWTGTILLLIVSIAIQANNGAAKKLPDIAVKTKSLTPIPPDLATSRANKDAKI